MNSIVTKEQAFNQSNHVMLWRAVLRTGEVIWEQPGLSSDALPADLVCQIDYVPRDNGLPTIETVVDLARGERFVRYWTTIWTPTRRGKQTLYVAGVERQGRHALLCFYPNFVKVVLAATRPFSPFWQPMPFGLLPPEAKIVGGPGMSYFGWIHDGFGGVVLVFPDNRLRFQSNYE